MLDAISAFANKVAYLAGDEICITLMFDNLPDDFANANNINIDLQRVECGRNQSTFGFGSNPSWSIKTAVMKQRLPDNIQAGLYVIDGAMIIVGDPGSGIRQQRVRFNPIFLAIQTAVEPPLTEPDLAQLIARAENERHTYLTAEIETELSRQGVGQKRKFTVLVFCVGCLLHSPQQLEGYSLVPSGMGLSHRRLLEIVNSALVDMKIEVLSFDP